MKHRIRLHFDVGQGEFEGDLHDPLSAPFRWAIKSGKPPGQWKLLLLSHANEGYWVAGTFMHTRGKRLLYFPGARIELEATARPPKRFVGSEIDHMTLDPPHKPGKHRSHLKFMAEREGKIHGYSFTTTARAGWMIPWFSLAFSGLDRLLKPPATLYLPVESPRPMTDAFIDALMRSGGMEMVRLPEVAGDPHFLQFDIWAARGDEWRTGISGPVRLAADDSLVGDRPGMGQTIPLSSKRFELAHGQEKAGIAVYVSRPAGKLYHETIRRLPFPEPDDPGTVQ